MKNTNNPQKNCVSLSLACPPMARSKTGIVKHQTWSYFDRLSMTKYFAVFCFVLTLFTLPTRAQMVQDMTSATTMTSTDLFYLVRGPADRKLTWSTLFDAVDDSVKDFLLTDFEGSVNLKAGSIGLSNLSTAVINYIDASGGGTITNNPDDVTLENKTGSTIGLKRNQPNQLNFLGGLKWGTDSTWRANKDSLVIYGLNKVVRYRFADDDSAFYITGLHKTTWNGLNDYIHYISGYNITPSGSRANSNDAKFVIFTESAYDRSPTVEDTLLEHNWDYQTADGVTGRILQMRLERNRGDFVDLAIIGQLRAVQRTGFDQDTIAFSVESYDQKFPTMRIYDVYTGGTGFIRVNSTATNKPLEIYQELPYTNFRTWDNIVGIGDELFITKSDYLYSTHADSSIRIRQTAAGYGIFHSKYSYWDTEQFLITNSSFTPKLIFDYASGVLTLGGTHTVGVGSLYLGSLYSGSTKVVGARDTGWTAFSGTPDESTSWDVSTVTLPQLAARVAALQVALTTHGLIGP